MNTCAVSNVRDHLYVKMDGCKRAEEKARTENMTEECIRMHHDMYLLYLGLVVEHRHVGIVRQTAKSSVFPV